MADPRRPRDRILTASIREWANENRERFGWPELSARGKLPGHIREAYDQAHDGLDDDEPDVSAADETDLDDVIDAEIVDDEDELPPPADLDEARERVGAHPGSAHLLRGRKPRREPKPKQPPPKVTTAVRRDIEGKVAFWLLIPAEPWMRVDPYCGKAFADNIDEIARKATPLLCQSPAVVRWFAKSTTFIQVTELAMACRPVAEAIIAHHITRRVSLDSLGNVVEQRDGGVDFSAYSARQPNPAAA